MSINWRNGDLLNSDCEYICHQVNCQGVMGSGIAKQIKEKWPDVYEVYKSWHAYHFNRGGVKNLLGQIQIVPIGENAVINMFSQEFFGRDSRQYTSYDAFWHCLEEIKTSIPKYSSIAFPYGIGCGLGGANWKVIEIMISVALGDYYDVYIYRLEE